MNSLDAFFTWPTLVFALAVYALTRFVRGLLEAYAPRLRGHAAWEDVALPTMPVLFGAALALVLRHYPFPASMDSLRLQAFLGAVIGGMSGWGYRITRAIVKMRWGVDLDTPSSTGPQP
jgi:hypothetical protein